MCTIAIEALTPLYRISRIKLYKNIARSRPFCRIAKRSIAVENYRPITCLNLLWKLLTSIFAEKTYKHLLQNELLPVQQKGCGKDSKGTKNQLIIDKMVMKNCKRRQTNLCMAWVDFKKAYDMVPHSWIVESLRMFGLAENLIHLLSINMAKWKTNLMANKKSLGSVAVKRGIFQGDSFSPLLFVIALIPISMALRKINMGYKLGKNAPSLNHLFFMDDLKVYGKSEKEIDSLVKTVKMCCKYIGMEFEYQNVQL